MNNELKYPVKYAVLELKERGGYSVGYNSVTQGFIASKCYVIESSIVYNSDGSNKIVHKVVFPYQDIERFKMSLRNGGQNIVEKEIPRLNAGGYIYPITEVSELFDTYELAKEYAQEKNEDYKNRLVLYVPTQITDLKWQEEYDKLKQEYDKRVEITNLFEQNALEKTKDMSVEEPYVKVLRKND